MENSDFILDFGPGAGESGGKIVAKGTAEEIKKDPNSITGQYLSGRKEIKVVTQRHSGKRQRIQNLQSG